MANYLITGSAGFIGARVSEFLLAGGNSVTGLDNLCEAYDVRVKSYRLKKLTSSPGFTFKKYDISDQSLLSSATISEILNNRAGNNPPFDAVINLAARAGVRQAITDPWVYVDTNVTGTLNLLELCRQLGIPKFLMASTSSVYGLNAPLPTPEEADSDHPMQAYAASKKAAEMLCHAYHHLNQLDIIIFRYFTVYGPAGRPDMSMFRFVQWISEEQPVKLYGDGKQSRAFTYIDDIARGTIEGLKLTGYHIINLGGHEQIQIMELIHLLESYLGKKALIEYHPANPADMYANWANVDKARSLLGWKPQVKLDDGIQNLIDWYNNERSWASQINTD
jgi:nucleoside-diphosphate-sugar epimerase